MNTHSSHWPLWSGFVLTFVALLSYPFVMVRFPITRDFPWLNLLLFGVAAALLVVGVRRSFGANGTRGRKITASLLAGLSLLVFALFVFSFSFSHATCQLRTAHRRSDKRRLSFVSPIPMENLYL